MLTPEIQNYLEEVWGYTNVKDIDPLTMDCIRENAAEGYAWDIAIIAERSLIRVPSQQ